MRGGSSGRPGAWPCGGGARSMGSIMTRMQGMRVRLRRGPRSATHPGHRPRVEGPTTSWGASTCTSSGSRGSLPAPTAKGSGPLWGLLWCDGGVWPWVSLSERKAPVASPRPQPRVSCRGCSASARLREQKPCRAGLAARTRPRWKQADAAAGPPAREREGSDWQEASSPRMRRETRPVSQ